MYNAATKLRLAKLNQENLALKIEQQKIQYTDDEICFRGYKESAEDETQTVEVEEKAVDENFLHDRQITLVKTVQSKRNIHKNDITDFYC